jgi:cytochrome b
MGIVMQIWDIYLRIFHWAFAISIVSAIISAEIDTEIHFLIAQFITFLLIFRLLWGFVGYPTARFVNFFPTPSKIKQYLGGNYNGVGHNPLGSLSVFAMLGLVIAQITTGIFTTDEILFEAPLYHLVSGSLQEILQELHDTMGGLLQLLILLHISAIIFYKLKGKNLVKDMLIGGQTNTVFSVKYMHLRAIIIILIDTILTYFIFY